MPVMEPMPTTVTRVDGVESNENTFKTHDQASEPVRLEGIGPMYEKNLLIMEEDQMRTPKLEQPPLVIESIASKLSELAHNKYQEAYQINGEERTPMSGHPDYFTQKAPQESVVADISRTPSSSNVSSAGFSGSTNSQRDMSFTPVSPDSRASTWKDYMPSFNPESNRPVSVPNFQSRPLSRRRDGPDYPNYPDQSFKALQNQHYPPPYQPGELHHLRTRSSTPSQNPSVSPNETSARGYPPVPSGAKTVGSTPAQSPGLFTPMLPKKHWTGEPDESRSGTPMLHPAHLQPPKE